MAAPSAQLVETAKTLPPRLIRFFTRFPPRVTPNTLEPPPIQAPTLTPSSTATETTAKIATEPNHRHILAGHPISDPNFNPFLPWKNPVTGRWRGAMYGLRKQADLCKLARKYGVEDLLPWSRKKLAVVRARKEQLGVRVKGTGVGQRVKGHIQERSMQSKMDARRDAMLKMPEMIREWKIRGHGRGWKKWPK